ncbi:OPT oligopeptide transporter protein-domain-containing protein [Mrakia frigida]|uniref:uncharacterized protein n=1 Tax=Mrakia frigida TaxID=29902 RepID=UPI003FCC1015
MAPNTRPTPLLRDEEEVIEGDFTFRAVSVGLLVGCLMAFTNLYFGLQTGWISMMSLQSALLGFGIFKLVPKVFPNSRPFTVQENVVLQTTAVATGTMPLAAGLVGIIPALEMLEWEKDGQGPVVLGFGKLVCWCLGVAFFGVFLAAPLRKQVIVKEKLVFPSGTATAQLISVLHEAPQPAPPSINPTLRNRYRSVLTEDDDEDELVDEELPEEETVETMGDAGWRALGGSFLASAGLTFLSLLFPIIYAIPIFDVFGGNLASGWMWSFSPSLSYVGQGIIMGFPTTLSMNLGMIVGWGILSPLAKNSGWAPGPVSDSTDGARGWILWIALAIMIAESVISLLPIVVSSLSTLLSHRSQRAQSKLFQAANERGTDYVDFSDEDEEEEEDEPPERLVPMSWVWTGLASSGVGGVGIVWALFGTETIKPWATAVGFLLACVLSLLGVRALGETDLNPVSGIGKISQLLFAVLQPNNVVANIIAGGVAEAGAQQAGDLMQDLKTGALLKASPRSQFYGQMIGSLASVFVSSAAYKLYKSVYEIPGPAFRVPTAAIWLNLARLLNTGHLPPYAPLFMILFGVIFSVLSLIKTLCPVVLTHPPKWIKHIPSGIAFAIGFMNTPSFSIARLLGGIIALRFSRNGKVPLVVIVIASGFVLGEGLTSIVGLVMKSFGFGVVSCWGCNRGEGGYCSSC